LLTSDHRFDVSDPQTDTTTSLKRQRRADALRNHDKLIDAAREVFAVHGTSASLDDIARRAGVGIGTLYRHFPSRQALLEAVYIDEVEAIGRAAEALEGLEPWDALATWLRQFVRYAATKRALAEELLAYIDTDAAVFAQCRTALNDAGEPLLARAQRAGVVRPDTDFNDVGRMIGGIAGIRAADPDQIERILELALDGLRYQAPRPAE
jgi:AcrR family transcriptional regulator